MRLRYLFVFVIGVHLSKIAHLVSFALFKEYLVFVGLGHLEQEFVKNFEQVLNQVSHFLLARLLLLLDQFRVIGLIEIFQVSKYVAIDLDLAFKLKLNFVHNELLDTGAF